MSDENDETPNPFHVIKDGLVFELDAMPEGGYFITVPALPGCTSFGESIDEALVMVQEAMELWVEGAREKGLPIPGRYDRRRVVSS
jgi:predicted RNase H-like HicB family nuclease